MGPNEITCTLLREKQREARCQEKENSVKPWKQRLGDVVTSQKMPAATRAGRGKEQFLRRASGWGTVLLTS